MWKCEDVEMWRGEMNIAAFQSEGRRGSERADGGEFAKRSLSAYKDGVKALIKLCW